MSEKIAVRDYFKGIEDLYDPKMVTVFTLKDFAPEMFYTEAEREFYKRKEELWQKKLLALGVRLCELHLSFAKETVSALEARLVIDGGKKVINLHGEIDEAITNTIKKGLALSVLQEAPFFLKTRNRHDTGYLRYYASDVPMTCYFWCDNDLGVMKPEEFNAHFSEEAVREIISSSKELSNIINFLMIYSEKQTKVFLRFSLKKDLDSFELERFLLDRLCYPLNRKRAVSLFKIEEDLLS